MNQDGTIRAKIGTQSNGKMGIIESERVVLEFYLLPIREETVRTYKFGRESPSRLCDLSVSNETIWKI